MWELNAERQGLLRVMAATRISPVNRHRPALRVAIGLVLKKSPAMGWATAQNDAQGPRPLYPLPPDGDVTRVTCRLGYAPRK